MRLAMTCLRLWLCLFLLLIHGLVFILTKVSHKLQRMEKELRYLP